MSVPEVMSEGMSPQDRFEIVCGPAELEPKLVAEITGVEHESTHTSYVIQVAMAEAEVQWVVKRRFSEFRALCTMLKAFFTKCAHIDCFVCHRYAQSLRQYRLPHRHWFYRNPSDLCQDRRSHLTQLVNIFCTHTFSGIPRRSQCCSFPFKVVRDFFFESAVRPSHRSYNHLRSMLQLERFAPVFDMNGYYIEYRQGRGTLTVVCKKKSASFGRAAVAQFNTSRRRKLHPLRSKSTRNNEQVDMPMLDFDDLWWECPILSPGA